MLKRSTFRSHAEFILTYCLAGLACGSVSARDDIPDDAKALKNPVTLEESEVRYYQRQFKGKCSRCHGLDGTGTGVDAVVAEGLVRPANFTDPKFMATRTDGQFFYQILMGGGERCAMPAFGPESDYAWTEDKIWHMVAFVRRFAETKQP
ncbi:MAG: cytochrome c [Deltaproteobacteria bacterium]|nr:cytochrome c [Deltaproteobacteria bacterium]